MKIKALHACNGGGKPMKPGKEYDVPDKDARYLIATKKAEPVEDKKSTKTEKEDTPKKGVNSKTGPR